MTLGHRAVKSPIGWVTLGQVNSLLWAFFYLFIKQGHLDTVVMRFYRCLQCDKLTEMSAKRQLGFTNGDVNSVSGF